MAPLLMVVFFGAVLIAVLAAVWFSVQAFYLRQVQEEMVHQLAGLENRQAAPRRPQVLPTYEELATLKRRIQAISAISDGQYESLPAFLRKIELLFPDEAYLVTIHYKQDTGEAQITAEARNAKVLTEFLLSLEKEKGFSEVLLTRQSQRISYNKKLVQFDLRIQARLL